MGLLIKYLIQWILWLVLILVGTLYIYSSVNPSGGIVLPYVSMPRFLNSLGACDVNGICDIASIRGCFICPYVQKLFSVIGKGTEVLWTAITDYVWVLLAAGLIILMFVQAYKVIMDANKENANLNDTKERKFDFSKWWEAVKKPAIRVLITGALLGVIGAGGTKSMQWTTDLIVYPTMMVGTNLAMTATGTGTSAACTEKTSMDGNPMARISDSFMCMISNLNAVVLYGAATGLAMTDMAWIGVRGGLFTWIGGFVIVIMFLIIGFGIMFRVLNVVFNLAFLVIFTPLFIASYAFEQSWATAKSVLSGAIGILAKTAVMVVAIALEIMIFSSLVNFSIKTNLASSPVEEYEIIEMCENLATNSENEIDKTVFKECFQREQAAHPAAFQYLNNGWNFLVTMVFVFLVYYVLVQKKLQSVINTSDKDAYFKFGDNLRTFAKGAWNLPLQIIRKVPILGKK